MHKSCCGRPLEKVRPFPDPTRETVLSLDHIAFHDTERPTSLKPAFLPDLTLAPPNDLDLLIGGAVERIFQPPRCQIHHHPPRCGKVVLREKCSPNRKKKNPLERSLQALSPYLRPGRTKCSPRHAYTQQREHTCGNLHSLLMESTIYPAFLPL